MHNGIYEAMEASEEIDGYCTDEELCTLTDDDLYRMCCWNKIQTIKTEMTWKEKQLYTDEKIPWDSWQLWSETDGGGNQPPESIFGNRKLFDYYPLRMKLFDYRQWQQLTYPSVMDGTDKWETELEGIINSLMVSPQ